MAKITDQTHENVDPGTVRRSRIVSHLTKNPVTLVTILVVVAAVSLISVRASTTRKAARFSVADSTRDGTAALQTDGSILFGAATPPSGNPLIWKPTTNQPLKLHWMLSTSGTNGGSGATINLNDPVQMGLKDSRTGATLPAPDVYDIDGENNSATTVASLHNLPNHPKVICYIDAGVYENYRRDKDRFPASVIGSADGNWQGSFWLDIRQISILEPIMKDRMQMCKDKGFDAIEPDEIDGYDNDSGFPLSYQNQLDYNKKIALWAHEKNISIGLKGDTAQIKDLVNDFDWTLNEECFMLDECDNVFVGDDSQGNPILDKALTRFVEQNKAVWVAEYPAEYPAKAKPRYKASDGTPNYTKICDYSKTKKWNTAFYVEGLPAAGGRNPCATTSATQW